MLEEVEVVGRISSCREEKRTGRRSSYRGLASTTLYPLIACEHKATMWKHVGLYAPRFA